MSFDVDGQPATPDAPDAASYLSARTFDRRRVLGGALLGLGSTPLFAGAARAATMRRHLTALGQSIEAAGASTTLRYAAIGPVTNIDFDGPLPAYFPNSSIWTATYDQLTTMDIPSRLSAAEGVGRTAGFPAQPSLAESWDTAQGGKLYRLNLRKGVKSTLGNELTAEDVVFTANKTFAAKSIGAILYTLSKITGPSKIKAVDTHTVEYALTAPSPYFLQLLVSWWIAPMDSTALRAHATAGDPYAHKWTATNTAGYGPYVISRFTQNAVTLTRRSDYWRPFSGPATIIQESIPSDTARLQLLLTGSANYADQLSPLEYRSVADSSTAKSVQFTSTVGVYLVLNTTKPPLNDVNIRQAIARAIPYDSIVKDIFYAAQAVRWYTLIPPWLLGATDEFWNYKYDVAAAKAGLKALAGKPLTLSFRAGRGAAQEIAILVQTSLRAAGANVQLNPLASARYDAIKLNHELDFFIAEETPIIPNSEYHLQQFFLPTGVLNMSAYSSPACNAVINKLIQVSTTPGTTAQQVSLIKQAQKILVHDLPQIPLAFTATEAAVSRSVRLDKYVSNPGGGMSGAQMILGS